MNGIARDKKDSPDRLRGVVADVLGAPLAEITDSTSPGSLPSWDSVNHLNIVMAVENEFGVAIPPDAALEMRTVGAFREFLQLQGIPL